MDRQFFALAAATTLALALPIAGQAQSPAGKPASAPLFDLRDNSEKPRPVDVLKKKLEELSPEERQRMRQNAERWMQLNPDERRTLRDREDARREDMKREANAALKESGLTLDADRREIFELRYMQERRKIEQRLRKEMVEKRQQLLPELTNRLKAEFSQPTPTPSPAP